MSRPLKPPNVLVYCGTKDTDRAFEDARKFVRATLNPNTYVIYNLKHEKVASGPWRDNTSLLFIATDRRVLRSCALRIAPIPPLAISAPIR